MPGIRNQWYVAAASSRLADKPRATRVLDLELVLFRDRDGNARALLDRCPHRGVRLSLGRMTEGALACGYHGWRFDGTGKCVHIPSLVRGQRIAAGCEVPAFRTVEQDGYIWIWVGDAEPAPAPRIPGFDRFRWVQGAIDMQCDALKVIENNFDVCHTFFAHVDTHPAYFETKQHGFRELQYEMRVSERGLDVFAPVTSSERDPIPDSSRVRLSYEVPQRMIVEFELGGRKRACIVMHVVPTSSNTCRLEWLYGPNPVPLWRSQLLWWPLEPKIFRQDRLLIESSQPWYDRAGDQQFERSVGADASTLMVRRIYDMALAGTWQHKWSSLPKRRVVDVRA